MALSTLRGYMQATFNWAAGRNMPASGMQLPQSGNSSGQGPKINYNTGGTGGATAANQAFFFFVNIAAGGSATFSLQNFTDVTQFSGQSITSLKAGLLWLLSKANDATNGTACSSVTVGNAAANPFAWFVDGTATTFTLVNGQFKEDARPDAAGLAVSGSANTVKIVNNDLVNSASVLVAGFGVQ